MLYVETFHLYYYILCICLSNLFLLWEQKDALQDIAIQNIYSMCFSKTNLSYYDDLNRPMENFLQHESLWNDKCDYIQPDNCGNLNNENYNLLILQLNIRGLLSHQDDLKYYYRN